MSRQNFIIIPLLVLSIFFIYHLNYKDSDNKARIWYGGEKEFFKSIDIVWRGEIVSTMASGSCIGLKGEFDSYNLAMACLSNTASNELWKFKGVVTVTGKWLGITCAYKNTIFGECVPDIRIDNIRQ